MGLLPGSCVVIWNNTQHPAQTKSSILWGSGTEIISKEWKAKLHYVWGDLYWWYHPYKLRFRWLKLSTLFLFEWRTYSIRTQSNTQQLYLIRDIIILLYIMCRPDHVNFHITTLYNTIIQKNLELIWSCMLCEVPWLPLYSTYFKHLKVPSTFCQPKWLDSVTIAFKVAANDVVSGCHCLCH